jgi:uncharacterized protein with GYD domain
MATYITLLKYTQKGIENIKDSANRLDSAKEAFKGMGADIKEFYLTMGQYDAIVIIEAPNDETVAKLALSTGSKGAVKTETFRAFPEDEYRKVIASLP